MEQVIDEKSLKRRSVLSITSLFFNSGYSSLLGLVANLVLTILLTPHIFGIYITVLSLIALLNYVADIGLAASLIQREKLTEDDVKTTFTVQQSLTLIFVVVGVVLTTFVQRFYKLPPEAIYLYWALLASFFLSSLKTIPSIFLERKIQFQKIVFVQVIENTVFYICVIILAFLGFGLTSFTYGVILRSVVGVILLYSISFWMPRIGFSLESFRSLLSFGLPFQASTFLALFKDDLIILYLSKVIGFESLGYVGWAKKWAESAVRIVMDNVNRVIFPVIARIQTDFARVGRLVDKTIYYQTALLAPAVLGAIIIMEKLVDVIPNYQKWEPALPMFYLFSISSFFISFYAPFINFFNALGKAKISFYFMIFYTALTWILTPYAVGVFGSIGFPMVHLLVSLSYIFVALKAKDIIEFSLIKSSYKFVISSLVMGIVVFIIREYINLDLKILIPMSILSGVALYLISLIVFFRVNIISEIKSFSRSGES